MTTPDTNPDFQAFLAWKAAQETAPATPAAPAEVKPTLSDVLHALIELAPLATEALKRTYHATVDEFSAVVDSVKNAAASKDTTS